MACDVEQTIVLGGLSNALRRDPVGRGKRRIQRPPHLPRFERSAAIIGGSLFQRLQPGAHFRQAAHYDHGHAGAAPLDADQICFGREDQLDVAGYGCATTRSARPARFLPVDEGPC